MDNDPRENALLRFIITFFIVYFVFRIIFLFFK